MRLLLVHLSLRLFATKRPLSPYSLYPTKSPILTVTYLSFAQYSGAIDITCLIEILLIHAIRMPSSKANSCIGLNENFIFLAFPRRQLNLSTVQMKSQNDVSLLLFSRLNAIKP